MTERSPKHQSPSRQSYFYMFFLRSITQSSASDVQESETNPQIKIYIMKGSQALNSNRSPLTLNFQNNWMKVEGLQLAFLLKQTNPGHDSNLSVKMNKLTAIHEELIGEIMIDCDKYLQAYLNEGISRNDECGWFGSYKVSYIIFTDRNRHNLQKIVKGYRNSQEFQEWSALKQNEQQGKVNNVDLDVELQQVEIKQIQAGQDQLVGKEVVIQQLVSHKDEDIIIETPKKNEEIQSPTQVVQKQENENKVEVIDQVQPEKDKVEEAERPEIIEVVLDKSGKNDQNQVSEVIEVSETYIINQDTNKRQIQILPQEKQTNQANQESREIKPAQISGFSEIKERSSELEEQTPEKNAKEPKQQQHPLNSSFVKKQTPEFYDRRAEYYQPPKQEQEEQIIITQNQPINPRTRVRQEQNKVIQTISGKDEPTPQNLDDMAQKTQSLLEVAKGNETSQPPKEQQSQVIETIGSEGVHTVTENKPSDWKLTLKILIFFILAGIAVIYFLTPQKEEKAITAPKIPQKKTQKQIIDQKPNKKNGKNKSK